MVLTGCRATDKPETALSDHSSNTSSEINSSEISSKIQNDDISSNNQPINDCKNNFRELYWSFDTTNDLIEGIKKVGIDEGNSENAEFYKWCLNRRNIVLPQINSKKYKVQSLEINESGRDYNAVYVNKDQSAKDIHNKIYILGYFLTSEETKKGLDYITESVVKQEIFSSNKKKGTIKNGNSRWGEYRFIDAGEDIAPAIWFIKDSTLFIIRAYPNKIDDEYADWKEEYFDYFDFKKVSLK